METIKGNYKKYLISNVFYTLAYLFATGSFVQTFMLAKGIDSNLVAVYTSIIQIAQTGAILLGSFLCDRLKKIKKVVSLLLFMLPVIFIGFLISEIPSIAGNTAYAIILITSIISNVVLGFYNIVTYKLPYSVIDMKNYGKLASVSSIISNVLSITITTVISLLVNFVDFFLLMFITFSLGIVLWVSAAIVTKFLKEKNIDEKPTENYNQNSLSLIKYPYFYKLIPANILRGIATGIITQIVIIGTFIGTLNTNLSVVITLITCLATAVGSLLYIYLEKRLNMGLILTAFGALTLLTMPLSVAFGVIPLYAFYFLTYLSNHVISVGMPVIVYKYVPYNVIGKYTAWRMMLFTLGCALPGFFLDGLLKSVGAIAVTALGAICMALSCISYTLVFRKAKPVEK